MDFSWSRREKVLAITLGVVIVLLLFSLFWPKKSVDPMEGALKEYEQAEKKNEPAVKKEAIKPSDDLWVDIKGAVRKPGIYKLKTNTRVFEAIEQAGGTVEKAEMNQINLAQPLVDGMVLYIPEKGEAPNQFTLQGNSNSSSSSTATGGKININTATEQELQTLPSIGAAKAHTIVQFRKDQGRFSSVDDLKKISGLGEKTIARFRDLITVS